MAPTRSARPHARIYERATANAIFSVNHCNRDRSSWARFCSTPAREHRPYDGPLFAALVRRGDSALLARGVVVLRKNSNPLDLTWWRDYWPAVASSQRDRSASYRPSVAGRPGRADRALGQTPASHRSREFGPASSAGALQGAGHETPAHRCRDARKLGLAVAVLRLALLPGDRPSGKRAAVATEPAGDYSGAASRDRGVRRFLSTCGDSYGAWPGRIRYGARKELQTSCC